MYIIHYTFVLSYHMKISLDYKSAKIKSGRSYGYKKKKTVDIITRYRILLRKNNLKKTNISIYFT